MATVPSAPQPTSAAPPVLRLAHEEPTSCQTSPTLFTTQRLPAFSTAIAVPDPGICVQPLPVHVLMDRSIPITATVPFAPQPTSAAPPLMRVVQDAPLYWRTSPWLSTIH